MANSNNPSTDAATTAVNQYLTGSTTVNQAADAICTPIEQQYQQSGQESAVENSLYSLWNDILSIARSTPWSSPQSQQLANLLIQISNRPTLQYNGQPCVVQGMTVWQDLPMLGWAVRDAWNFDSFSATPDQQTQWLNLNGFVCAYTSAIAQYNTQTPRPVAEWALFGLWTIRTGLEQTKQPAEIDVDAAAIWLSNGATTLWQLSEGNVGEPAKTGAPGALFQGQGWTGFSVDRWNAWAQQLTQLASNGSLSAGAEQLVGQALDGMAQNQS